MTKNIFADRACEDILMDAFCRGDETAFVVLYDCYAPEIEQFLRRFVRDERLAEEALETTFKSFVVARGRYEPSTGARNWLYSIAHNAGRDALRRLKTARTELLRAREPHPSRALELANCKPLVMGAFSPNESEGSTLWK